jgi:hypothetical protein
MDIKSFNSGRGYSAKGQRIAYCAVQDGVLMADVDRHINYYFFTKLRPEWLTNDIVLSMYDNGSGQSPREEDRKLVTFLEAEALKL